MKNNFKYLVPLSALFVFAVCGKESKDPIVPTPSGNNEVEVWVTRADKSELLKKQNGIIQFNSPQNQSVKIDVDSTVTFQTIDGFGYTLTGGSASLINHLPASEKTALLEELFGNSENSIKISYLRVSIGASDLSSEVFSYNDLAKGETDLTLSKFSLSKDTIDLIPILKQIVAINPDIKIMGSPWSPPVWMKENEQSMGGGLLTKYYDVYAQYFIRYIQAMAANGIKIDAITPQNEPQHGGNNPSMLMSAGEQANFIKSSLGPAFKSAGIKTKIVIWDHNCDNANYPITILNDAAAKQHIDGSAFHLYNGDISALSTVHTNHPDKNLYFTEQWTGAKGSFDGDLKWHIKNVVIGSVRNWSKIALEWNLANDQNFNPHTPGGCTECKGALTISGVVERNVSYYIIGQISKFVPAGSVRISSSDNAFPCAAFLRPDGKKVLIALNESIAPIKFNLQFNKKWAAIDLPANGVATYVW